VPGVGGAPGHLAELEAGGLERGRRELRDVLLDHHVAIGDPEVHPGHEPSRLSDRVRGRASERERADQGHRVDLRLGVDSDGEIYMLTKGYGDIYRFLFTSVPEPASWAMALLGFGAVGAALRRRPRFART